MAMPTPSGAQHSAGHRHTAFVIAILLTVGLLWGALQLVQVRFAPSEWQPATWVDGYAGRAVNTALGTLPGQLRIDRWSAALRYKLLGDVGEQVREGCSGWLFYRDGLRPPPGHSGVFSKRAELMRHWASRLEKAGIHLLIATVPDKSRIETSHLCGLHPSPLALQRWDAWQMELAAAGVSFVNLQPVLARLPQAFYRTDVHMASPGAEAATRHIAETLLPSLGGKGPQKFLEIRGSQPQVRMGDLVVLANLEHAPVGWRPALEQVVPVRVEAQRSAGLLDEGPLVEVVLAGDSNGLRSEFAERLGRGLGREIWNLSEDGGYFPGAMLAALARQESWPASLKAVVWVFSELSLSLPLSVDEQQALAEIR